MGDFLNTGIAMVIAIVIASLVVIFLLLIAGINTYFEYLDKKTMNKNNRDRRDF